MVSNLLSALAVPALLFSSHVQAQATIDYSALGPTTSLADKSKVCNVLDYGAVADNSTDIGPAITSAFTECAMAGGATIYIPPGTYSIQTGVVLSGGSAYAMQIDGLIILTSDGDFDGNAIVIENTSDVEVFSSNALGAINGQGYITRITDSSQNARLFRMESSTNIAIHDMIFVDSPTFHLVFDTVSNMEAYHITVRGPNLGGTDGVDVECSDNCYVHEVEVTNLDECISVKSPSNNILVEDIYCNHSGGMSIGSLTADITSSADISTVSNVTMRNIQAFECTQVLMLKTFPGGTGAEGYLKQGLFENFWGYNNTYTLEIDQYWEETYTPDTGAVAISELTFSNWTGSMINGASRGAVVIEGSDIVPLVDITVEDFSFWTVESGAVENRCANVYGSGACIETSSAGQSLATFTTTTTSTTSPSAWVSPTSPAWGIQGYGITIPIPVYTPAVFWSPVSSGVASTSATGASAAAVAVETGSASSAVAVKAATSSEKAVVASETSSAKKTTSTTSSSTSGKGATSNQGSGKGQNQGQGQGFGRGGQGGFRRM